MARDQPSLCKVVKWRLYHGILHWRYRDYHRSAGRALAGTTTKMRILVTEVMRYSFFSNALTCIYVGFEFGEKN